MLPHTSAPLGESGGRSSQPHPILGEHITATRNIKQNSGWLWQEKQALKLIAQSFSGDRLRAARSIYLALTEIASNQFTPARAHTSCAYLGAVAGLGENAVRRYLHEFERLGLTRVEAGIHRANTYVLLAIASNEPTDIASREMKLADGRGVSLAPAEIDSDNSRAPAAPSQRDKATPTAARATRRSTQDSRILQNNKESTTNNVAGVATIATLERDGNQTDNTSTPHIPSNVSDRLVASPVASPTSPPPAAIALTSLGVRLAVATRVAAEHDEQQILGWVRYTRTAPNLKSRAGFVLTMLQQNQEPPSSGGPTQCWNTHPVTFAPPEPAQGLTEATTIGCANLVAAPEVMPPPGASAQAIWHAVKEELLSRANAATRMWLQHIRLIVAEADCVVLSSPPLGGLSASSDMVREDIATLMGVMMGHDIQVEFQSGW